VIRPPILKDYDGNQVCGILVEIFHCLPKSPIIWDSLALSPVLAFAKNRCDRDGDGDD
jgi:hypothetical protein